MLYLASIAEGNFLLKNPPAYLTRIDGREVAVYTGIESVLGLSKQCQNELVSYCRRFLYADKINAKRKLPVGSRVIYTDDAPKFRLVLIGNKLISDSKQAGFPEAIPFVSYEY